MSSKYSSLRALLVAGLLAGCGGGGSEPVNPPPPPSPPGPPATVVVQQGDGQQGEPGAVLATPPAVIVKDASGRGVPGISVNFAVDSGSGTITSGQTATGTNGVATAGSWTLGGAEGRNTLLVTAGSLPALKIAASAVIAPLTVAQGQVALTGGTITVVRPGTPLNGLKIIIPDSAFTSQVSFTVGQKSSAGLSIGVPGQALSAAVRTGTAGPAAMAGSPPVTPVITIVTNGPAAAAGEVVLQIPVPPGTTNPLVAVVDAAGTPLAFLPVLSRDLVSVTVTTRALSPALFVQIGNIGGASPAPPHTLSLVVFQGPSGPPRLGTWAPYAFGYNYVFGKNDLAFYQYPTTHRVRMDIGISLVEYASLWYFPGGIHHAWERAPGVVWSDTRGIKASAGITTDAIASMGGRYGPAWVAYYRNANIQYDYEVARLVLNMLWYGNAPVPLWLTEGNFWYMVSVIGWEPSTESLIVRDPNYSSPRRISFSGGTMAPYADAWSGVQFTIPYASYSWLASFWPQLASQVSGLGSATAADPFGNLFKNASFQTRGSLASAPAVNAPDSVFFLADTNRVWAVTPSPPLPIPTTLPLAAGYGLVLASLYDRGQWGTWATTPSSVGSSFFFDWKAFPDGKAETIGLAILESQVVGETHPAWAGWREIRLIKYGITLAAQVNSSGTPSVFTPTLASASPRLPSGAKFEWDFGDNTPKQTVTSLGPINHTYTSSGAYTVVLQVIHPAHNIAIARISKGVSIDGATWMITHFSDPDSLFDDGPPGTGDVADLLGILLNAPTAGLLEIASLVGGGTDLRIRVLRSGLWSPTVCCAPTSPLEIVVPLGVAPTTFQNVGPFFAGWGSNFWNQSTTNLDAGTMTAQHVMGMMTYDIKDVGIQAGPAGGLRFSATRSGRDMVGTLFVYIWFFDPDTGITEDPAAVFRFPFTAIRVPQ